MRGLRRRARGKGGSDRPADEVTGDGAVEDGGATDPGAADGDTPDGDTPDGGTDDGDTADGSTSDGGGDCTDTDGADGAADSAPDSGGTAGRSRLRARLFPVVSGIVIVALVVVMGLLLWQRYGTDETASGDDGTLHSPAVDVAEQVVLGITNINPESVESNADTVLSHSTGAFHDDYEAAKGQFATLVGEAEANSTGRIVQSGLESIGGDKATVLVVVSTDVQNKALPEASQRGFRLRVTLEKEGDSYKVSNLEQVP